jgi:tight adherence protein C
MFDFLLASTVARLATLLGIFAIVAIGSFVLLGAAARRRDVRKGLLDIAGDGEIITARADTTAHARNISWAGVADMIERYGLNLGDTNEVRLREKMLAAGFTSPAAPRIYTLVRLLLIIVLPLVYGSIALTRPEPSSFLTIYLIGVFMALLGLLLPSLYVQAKADRRREAVINGFPDCLDLLLVCVEAGLGIEAAMDRVGREMVHSHPLVAELLAATTLHLRAGSSKEQAYRRMADMSHVAEIRSFATLLIQSDKLGTSISATLRVYAEEMREKRRMRAEEKAHRLPVLISIPLVVFMLPTMIGVLMLPASIRMVREIFPLMTGG